jgi:hypothetical protein
MNKEIIFSAKEYKEKYNDLLETYLLEYEDYEEIDFINSEIQRYNNSINDLEQLENYIQDIVNRDWTPPNVNKTLLKICCNESFDGWIDYKKKEQLTISLTKIIKFLELQKENPNNNNIINWNGTQTDFIELVKALIENGNLKGTQTEIIKSLSNVFNIKINNENKLINDIKIRNNGSETLFLDKLKKTLFDYITLENKK